MAYRPPKGQTPECLKPHQWKKGQSGNPNPRNNGSARMKFAAILEQMMLEEVTVRPRTGPGMKRPRQQMLLVEALLDVFVRKSLRGEFQFAKELLERVAGKVPQQQHITGVGTDVRVVVEYLKAKKDGGDPDSSA